MSKQKQTELTLSIFVFRNTIWMSIILKDENILAT
jgi:hypothetical protein